MIPVLDIAKANPRIPLPIMALLRLKMDIPNEVFPTNCSEGTTEDGTQTDQYMNSISCIYCISFLLQKLNLTSAFSDTHICKVFFLDASFVGEKLLMFSQGIQPIKPTTEKRHFWFE